jgi:hypothetical protein
MKHFVIQDETGMFDQKCSLELWPGDPVEKEDVEKYNHNHGPNGRFAPSTGGATAHIGGTATMPAEERTMENGLTQTESLAVHEYQGADYAFINTWMRNPDNGGNQQDKEFYLRKASNIERAIDKQPPLKGEEIVYRGIRTDKKTSAAFIKDAIIEDKAFMSTTADREVAKNFGNTVLTIRVPKGTKALKMQEILHNPSSEREKELLLQRGTKLKITHVRQESGGFLGMGAKTYIDARVVE